jgi:hyperosmotically inducible periplasmic protein
MFRILSVSLIVAAVSFPAVGIEAKPEPSTGSRKTAAVSQEGQARQLARLVRQVRNELVTLPYYGVFDWLEGEVKGDGTVVLRGQVVRPTTKSDAEGRVKDVEGVERVVNEIEVLPLSPNDDRIRLAVYRAIFNYNSPLFRYATQAVPPIHIIVRNGRVTLKGVVANKGDSTLANVRARGVPGVFEVTNQLQVEQQERS